MSSRAGISCNSRVFEGIRHPGILLPHTGPIPEFLRMNTCAPFEDCTGLEAPP
jgi:hypothetical protein